MRRPRGTRRSIFGLVTATTLLVLGSGASAAGEPAPFFSVRLEGTALRAAAVTQARNLNPAPAYSFANVTSIEELDGSRGLQMKAVGTTNDPGDLGGVALFAPTTPTRGAADFPNYSEAFFPAFEDVGQTTVAEKCAVNNTAKAEPTCAEQPGPYALARVEPDELAPGAIGIGRNVGDDGSAETFSRSEIKVGDAGEVIGTQVNAGRDLTVPGTPITVTSFRTESRVVSTVGSVTVEGACDGTVKVNGEVIDSNDELQTLVAAVAGAGISVEYTPPTPAKVVETFGGTKEVGCSGPRFIVSDGSSAVAYTYGRTFATGSPGSEKPTFDDGSPSVDDVLDDVVPPPPAPGGSAELPGGSETAPAEPPPTSAPAGRTEAAGDRSQPASTPDEETAAPGLVERRIKTLPLAAATTAAATALPLAVWLLLGVVGSLSRGYTRLRLPPFRD